MTPDRIRELSRRFDSEQHQPEEFKDWPLAAIFIIRELISAVEFFTENKPDTIQEIVAGQRSDRWQGNPP